MPFSKVFSSYKFSNAFGWTSDSLIFVVGFVKEDERFLAGDRVIVGFVSNWKNLSPKKQIYIYIPKLVSNKTLVQNLRRENEYRKMKTNTNPLGSKHAQNVFINELGFDLVKYLD